MQSMKELRRDGRVAIAALALGTWLTSCGDLAEEAAVEGAPSMESVTDEASAPQFLDQVAWDVTICVSCDGGEFAASRSEAERHQQMQMHLAMRQAEAEARARAERLASAARQRALQNEAKCRKIRDDRLHEAALQFDRGMSDIGANEGRCVAQANSTGPCVTGSVRQQIDACLQLVASNLASYQVGCVGTLPPPPRSAAVEQQIAQWVGVCAGQAAAQSVQRRSWCQGGENFGNAGSARQNCVREATAPCRGNYDRAELTLQQQRTRFTNKIRMEYNNCVDASV